MLLFQLNLQASADVVVAVGAQQDAQTAAVLARSDATAQVSAAQDSNAATVSVSVVPAGVAAQISAAQDSNSAAVLMQTVETQGVPFFQMGVWQRRRRVQQEADEQARAQQAAPRVVLAPKPRPAFDDNALRRVIERQDAARLAEQQRAAQAWHARRQRQNNDEEILLML